MRHHHHRYSAKIHPGATLVDLRTPQPQAMSTTHPGVNVGKQNNTIGMIKSGFDTAQRRISGSPRTGEAEKRAAAEADEKTRARSLRALPALQGEKSIQKNYNLCGFFYNIYL